MQVTTTAEQLFFVTARLQGVGTTSNWVGTGFVYAVTTDRGTAHFLVTNKHVLDGAHTLHVSMIAAGPDGSAALGKPATITWTGFSDQAWAGHPDPKVDVAALSLSPLLNVMATQGTHAFFRTVDASLCVTPGRAAKLDALESVVFVGYPSGIYDTTNLIPIIRRGMTATPIAVDYRGLPAFLVDAAVFPGSSGSPVFLFDRGAYQERSGGTVVGTRLMLLGVLAAVHVQQVEGRGHELPARLAVDFDQPLGLGIVFRAETIEASIEPLLVRAGLARTADQPPSGSAAPPSAADQALDKATPPT